MYLVLIKLLVIILVKKLIARMGTAETNIINTNKKVYDNSEQIKLIQNGYEYDYKLAAKAI